MHQEFSDLIPKKKFIKEKINKLEFIKWKMFALVNPLLQG